MKLKTVVDLGHWDFEDLSCWLGRVVSIPVIWSSGHELASRPENPVTEKKSRPESLCMPKILLLLLLFCDFLCWFIYYIYNSESIMI